MDELNELGVEVEAVAAKLQPLRPLELGRRSDGKLWTRSTEPSDSPTSGGGTPEVRVQHAHINVLDRNATTFSSTVYCSM